MQFQNNPGDQEEKIRRFFRTNSPWIVRVFPGTGDAVSDSRDRISMIHNFDETDISFVVLALRSAAARQLQGTATQHVFEVERTVGYIQIALGI
jgi:hypothetical protein